jgi:hypothetical protein
MVMKWLPEGEAELRLIARRRIEQGQLPSKAPSQMWAGHGTGQRCALCDEPIQHGEIEWEVEEEGQGACRVFPFHSRCQAVWEMECGAAPR